MSEDNKKYNGVLSSYCPICGRALVWLDKEPDEHPGADYVAFCLWCLKEFGVSIHMDSKGRKTIY